MSNLESVEKVFGAVHPYLESTLGLAKNDGLELARDCHLLDHIGVMLDNEDYGPAKEELLRGEHYLLDEKEVNGRLISVFRLAQAIEHGQWRIPYLEVQSFREGRPRRHLEFVPYDDDLRNFMDRYPDLTFEQSGLDRPVAPEVKRYLGDTAIGFRLVDIGNSVRLQNLFGQTEINDAR